ncbi:MAG TPA: carboxymuconolactone decarboxylase family protein [Aeromicrobium sp.]|nr:carboxymuconolactone decarboxylase family protein [Aeromicrobium sp.]
MSRLPVPTLREAGPLAWGFARISGRVIGTEPPLLFLTIGRQHALFRGWLHFAGKLMPGGRLPRRESELVILRVANQRQCDYEAEHHRRLGRRAGLTAEEIGRVADGPGATGWTPREAALLRATDALVTNRDLNDAEWAALRNHLSERDVVEFLLLVGHYDMLATFVNTLRLPPDPPLRAS